MTTRLPRPSLTVITLVAVAVLLGGWGCDAPVGTPLPNRPPETFLSTSGGEVDTTFYIIHLNWWGSDQDGRVDRYEFRWDGAWTPAPEDTLSPDSVWVVTRGTRRDFLLPVLGEVTSPVFTVRAIDDENLPDPTPVVQEFHVRDQLPTVDFGIDLERPARSLPAVTFSLVATDPDGDDTVIGYRVWFEGQDPETEARVLAGTSASRVTIEPGWFPGAGTQTVHFQSMDEALSFSPDTASHTWDVIETTGRRVLLIDHYPDSFFFGAQVDAFYRDQLESGLGTDAVARLRIESDGTFRTPDEVLPALSPFEAVFWYSGLQVGNVANSLDRIEGLRLASTGLEAYVEGGGNLYLQTPFAFGDGLPRSEGDAIAAWDSVATYRVLGLTGLHTNPEGNTNFFLLPNTELLANDGLGLPNVRAGTIFNYVDFMGVPEGFVGLAWIPPGTVKIGFNPDGTDLYNPIDYYCGVEKTYPGGGRFVFLNFPLSVADRDATAGAFFDAILSRLLTAGP